MMKAAPHLLVYISGHGYGHLAQVAPVLNALHGQLPQLQLSISSAIPLPLLRQRIRAEFLHIAHAADFGMVMHSALAVDVEASIQAYADFHRDWPDRLRSEADRISGLSPDLVLSDVAYLPLAAAASLGIPSMAMSSLNWADIFEHYCGHIAGATPILRQMRAAYIGAQQFIRLLPAMPMPWLERQGALGPVADKGRNQHDWILQQLGLPAEQKLALASMGGVATKARAAHWPRLPGLTWLLPADWIDGQQRADMRAFEPLAVGFLDLLASADLLFTKPGYGAFTEAACNGVPLLYVTRDDWPEQSYLVSWLESHGRGVALTPAQFEAGAFADELGALLNQPKLAAVASNAASEVAARIVALLSG